MSYYSEIYQKENIVLTERRYEILQKYYQKFFGDFPQRFFSSPGRCELLGNHTDHNKGKVLVAAITYDIIVAASPCEKKEITLLDPRGIIKVDLNSLQKVKEEEGSSPALIRGVCAYFKDKGYNIGGFSCALNSLVPSGSGLSSSAAFELLMAQILSSLYNDGKISPLEKAKASKFAENVYFNKPCGLLDQCGVALGGVTYIDFEKEDDPLIKSCLLDLEDKCALIIKTAEGHANLTSHYGQIKEDMMFVAQKFGAKYLSEVPQERFLELYNGQKTPSLAFKRARHFFEENKRVEDAYNALNNNNIAAFFKYVTQSGLSSCHLLQNCALPDEKNSPIMQILDFVQSLDKQSAVRVHGGGFRGGVLVFTSKEYADILKKEYKENCLPLSFRQKGACEVQREKLFDKAR